MNKKVIFIVASLILFGAALVIARSQTNTTNGTQSIPSSTAPTNIVLPSIDVSVPGNWVPFTSEKYGFFIRYPLDVNHQTTQEGEQFYKLGPSQSQGTELYDGISVGIKSGSISGKSFEDFVKQKHIDMKNDPLQPQVGDINQVAIGGIQGFSFRVSSIGDSTFIYLPKGEREYFEIINGTVEPTNREQTFQKTVEQMLSTLKAI